MPISSNERRNQFISLTESLYSGIDPSTQAATSQTGYKWSFASNKSRVDNEALRAVRTAVGQDTYSRDSLLQPNESGKREGGNGRVQGPTLPSVSDLVLAREAASEYDNEERKYKRKRELAEAKDRVEDMVGPREVGREAMLEKKRARREGDRAFREKGDDGFEADDATLLGGGDSFRDRYVGFFLRLLSSLPHLFFQRIARRDAARKRFEEKREAAREEKGIAARERVSAMREKDKATMDMFQQLAKQRFG